MEKFKNNRKLIFTLSFQFLTKLHLMDYSLLLGIHDCSKADDDSATEAGHDGNRSDPHHENSDSEECDSGDR
jgi:hypothetical protein